jgi:K+-sensing histidine kinase KdpD
MVLGFREKPRRATHLTAQPAGTTEADSIAIVSEPPSSRFPLPLGEGQGEGLRLPHVLVSVTDGPNDLELIRHGRLLADLLRSRLTVLYAFRLGVEERERAALARDRRYARSIGAPLVELPVYSVATGIAEFAQTRGVTHVVINDVRPAVRTGLAPLTAALTKHLDAIDFYVVQTPSDDPAGQRSAEGAKCLTLF